MRTISAPITLYKYEELAPLPASKALNRLIWLWVEHRGNVPEEALPGYDAAVEQANRMDTPWFLSEMIYSNCKEFLEMELREFYYERNGEEYEYIYWVEDEYGEEIENEQVER